MRDADYIPASERDDYAILKRTVNIIRLADSHAVADSVMQELADALRGFLPDEKKYAENSVEVAAHHAIARFDALRKDEA